MIYITLLALFGAAFCGPLEDGLKSGEALLALFSEFSSIQGQHYSLSEAPMRLRVFRSELKAVVETNAADLGYVAGLNFLSAMTEAEKAQYLGVNATTIPEGDYPATSQDAPTAAARDWRSSGAVTAVKDQGACGSCWAFAAVSSIEGAHKIKAGSLVAFSEQEVLDCTYEGRGNGCNGGWYWDAFKLIQGTQRLASMAEVRYNGRDGQCSYSGKPNSLKAKVTGYTRVSKNEAGLVSALAGGPVSVAYHSTRASMRYRSGEFRDNSCTTRPNHAVTAVGYTATGIILKNSWTAGWGDSGYITFKRGHHNCGLYTSAAIVTMSAAQEQEE